MDNRNSVEIDKGRVIGSLFILAFFAYGFGRYYFESEANHLKFLGAAGILLNSLLVLFIGIFFKRTLQKYNSTVADIYLFTRVFEALALASVVLNLIPGVTVSDDLGYFLAMLVLGLGSMPMCMTLYQHKISPSWLAIWGVLGYAIFSFGFLMELFGKEWSMYLLGVAGLWEISFAVWLIFKGGKNGRTAIR